MAWAFLVRCRAIILIRVWETKKVHTRRLLYFLKVLLIINASVGAWQARKSWKQVEGHPELNTWPYNLHGNMGEAWWWGYIGLIMIALWSFLSAGFMKISQGRYMTYSGLVDFGLAIFLCYGARLQDRFLPRHIFSCSSETAEHWQVVDSQPSLFNKIAQLEGGTKDAKFMCKEWTARYATETTSIFFQFLVAYIGIFSEEGAHACLNAWRPLVWILYIFPIIPLAAVIYILRTILPPVRLCISRAKKSLYRLRRPADLAIPELTRYKASERQFDLPKTKLIDILCIEHLLLNVVENMHYQDVVNVSSICRAAREAVFPRNDLAMRVPKLKTFACEAGTKSTCQYCNRIVCFWCTRTIQLPSLSGRRHTTKCTPYCRTCYYTSFSLHPRGWHHPCKGHHSKDRTEEQGLCTNCADNYSESMRLQRKRRFQQLAINIACGRNRGPPSLEYEVSADNTFTYSGDIDVYEVGEDNMLRRWSADGRHCGKCKVELPFGMRWWVCGLCEGECRHHIHPSYVRRNEMWNADVEKTYVAEPPVRWWKRWLG